MSIAASASEQGTERIEDRRVSIVHVVRHGEVYNPERILYGRLPNYRLSGLGMDQAALTAKYLADRDVGYLVASPLERAQQTARPISDVFDGLEVHTDERLIEAANRFEGQRVAGGAKRIFAPRNWPLLWNPLRPSWGEPYADIAHRMVAAVRAAAEAADGREAVCVTHQLPVVALRRFVEGRHLWHDPRQRQCALASVTSFVVDGAALKFYAYAEPAGATPSDAVPGA